MKEFCTIHKVPLQIMGNKWRCPKCEAEIPLIAQAMVTRNSSTLPIYLGIRNKIGDK